MKREGPEHVHGTYRGVGTTIRWTRSRPSWASPSRCAWKRCTSFPSHRYVCTSFDPIPQTLKLGPARCLCRVSRGQVWVGTLKKGPAGAPLSGTYKNVEGLAYQDQVGDTVLHVLRTVPHGTRPFDRPYTTTLGLTPLALAAYVRPQVCCAFSRRTATWTSWCSGGRRPACGAAWAP